MRSCPFRMQTRTSLKTDDLALLLGRLTIAALFLPSGLAKVMNYSHFAASMVGKSLPFAVPLPLPAMMALLAVTIEVLGTTLVLVGFKTRWVALAMVLFVLMATLTT